MDSALSGDVDPGAMHNEDFASLNKLIDEDEGFKMETDQSFLDDIARQQAEIIHGFPLASLMGASDAARHLPSLQAVPITHFPYIPPKSSYSSRAASASSSSTNAQPSNETRSHVHDDPLFQPYAREARLLLGPTKLKETTVTPEDWARLKSSARDSLQRALESEADELSQIVWKDPPFGNPPGTDSTVPYSPGSLESVRRADPWAAKSVAVKFQDDVKLSYPSPYSSTPASFTPVPPLLLNTRKAEVDLDALTEEQQASADAGVRFMRSLIQPKLDAQGKEIPRKSPIPLISASSSSNGPSSATVTPRKSTTPYLHLNSASASAGKPSIHLVSHSDTHVFPSPASQGLSSPDPLAIPRCQSSKPSSSSSSTGWVVEVPAHPKKRLSNANLIEKAAKRHAPHLPSDPFDTYTSSEMDVDPPLDVDDNAHSTSPPSAPSPHIDLPTRKKGKVGQVQSPSKAASLKSTAQLQEQQLQDFVTLVEDILDEEETPTSKYYIQPSLESFSGSETSRLLEPSTMRKISKGVRALVKTNSGKKSFGQKVEVDQMNRLLRILQRSITIAENLAIVPVSANGSKKARNQKSPSKTPKKNKKASSKSNSESPMPSSARRRSTRSATPASYHEDDDEEDRDRDSEEDYRDVDEPTTPSSQSRPKLNKRTSSSATKARKGKKVVEMEEEEAFEWDPDNLQLLENNLIALKNAIIATETVMIILGSASLPKQLYSEDVINSGLNLLKAQLTAVIYPSLDCERSTLGSATQEDGIATSIRKILTAASASFTGIAMLLKQEEATDTAVINAVYIAIAPFFCEYGVKGKAKDVLGALEMKVVRGQALVILRTIFARYPDQRQWILEEVLSSITKLPDLAKRKPQYLLHNGQAIQAISALLLHIVQSCTSGLRANMLAALRENSNAVKPEENDDGGTMDLQEVGDATQAAQRLVEPAWEAAKQSAGVIIGYLVKRSGKAPKNSTAGEAEYKALLEHLVRDLLTVLELPEWPAAPMMLQIAIRAIISVLDENKGTADVNTAKGICLEHLGTISSKVYKMAQSSKAPSGSVEGDAPHHLMPMKQIFLEQDRKALRRLGAAEQAFLQQLQDEPSESEDIENAVDFGCARWGGELLQALHSLPNLEEVFKRKFEKELRTQQNALWQISPSEAALQISNDEYRDNLQQSLRTLFPVHGLSQSMDTLLSHVLEACEGAIIAFRQKALKALASIVEQDTAIFLRENVRQAVEKRLMDSSPAVRDAALEMLGRYVVYRPELAQEYLVKIGDRINDSGLSVRKRVIKLLKTLYPILDGVPQRAGICKRLVGRVYDEDDNVKELASAAFEEIFLPSSASLLRTQRPAEDVQGNLAKKRVILSKARVLMSVAAEFRDRPNPLEDVLRKVFEKYTAKKGEKGPENLANITNQLKEIIEILIDNLVDPAQTADFKLVHCVKTVYILLSPDPSMIDVGRASLLLPYLKSATNAEEQAVVEYLSKIFTLLLPTLPRSASIFAQRLQDSLRGLLNKPAAIGVQALPDVVACFCSVVVHQTNDYGKMCSVFQTCYNKLQQGVDALTNKEKPPSAEQKAVLLRNMPILARLVSLFCQFGEFDSLRESSPDAAVFVNAISRNSIHEQVYGQMIQLYHLSAGTPLHGTALQCLGFLYRAHPMFMLEEESTAIMDKIFTSSTVEAKALLLRIICDFLMSQAQMVPGDDRDEPASDIDMRLLIGNTDNFADSGVSSAIVQRYLHHILEAALTPASSQQLLRPALDAIGFTVRQGLAHPMQCLPVLVALETSADATIVSKAFALHSLLHEKHSGLINTRLAESIDVTIRYQTRVQVDKPIMGYAGEPPSALLCKWYSLMREKRQWRNEFLKAFMRGLHVEPTMSDFSQGQINVARFTAENLATFDFKTMEEVFFVVRTLTILLSVAGMQIYHQMQKEERLDMDVDEEAKPPSVSDSVIRKSVALSLAFGLRQHLKSLYGVTDQKMAKYVVGKKSPAGDRPAVPKGGEATILSYEGLPFAVKAMNNEGDRAEQCRAYIAMIDSDGSIKEVDGDQESEEEL